MALLQIDATTRGDHVYLRPDDYCLYIGDYTARGGFGCSPINNLVLNFKKPVSRRGLAEYVYKERAIERVGRFFRDSFSSDAFRQVTFVPIPPSKARHHPEHDDRVMRSLSHMAGLVRAELNVVADIREIVVQRDSYDPSHMANAGARMHADDLLPLYMIDDAVAQQAPARILVVDDVLTTGSHFVAMKTVLTNRFPGAWIGGLFVARRRPSDDAAIAPRTLENP
jgi:hypothetical protein